MLAYSFPEVPCALADDAWAHGGLQALALSPNLAWYQQRVGLSGCLEGDFFLGGQEDAQTDDEACFAAIMMSALSANAGRLTASRDATCTRTSSGNWRKKIRRRRTS